MPSRRFHKKSRTGCVQCKDRKVKCDEEKPTCQKCHKQGSICSFADGQASLVIINTNPVIPSSTGPLNNIFPKTGPDSDEIPSLSTLSLDNFPIVGPKAIPGVTFTSDERYNLQLMHYYCTVTCKEVSDASNGLSIWQEFIPQLAMEHNFLLSGLLAVTSLHLALLHPTINEHKAAALRHHTTAIELFRPHVAAITKENIHALFAFSCLAPLYSFGIHGVSDSHPDPLQEIHEVFVLLQGIQVIAKTGGCWLMEGPLSSIMPQPSALSVELPSKTQNALSDLSEKASERTHDNGTRAANLTAIELLRHTLTLWQEKPGAKITALPFPIMVPVEFMGGLERREPMALCILAHYAVVLYRLREHIWLRDWGSEIVEAVKNTLKSRREGDWETCIEWAVREVEGGRVMG